MNLEQNGRGKQTYSYYHLSGVVRMGLRGVLLKRLILSWDSCLKKNLKNIVLIKRYLSSNWCEPNFDVHVRCIQIQTQTAEQHSSLLLCLPAQYLHVEVDPQGCSLELCGFLYVAFLCSTRGDLQKNQCFISIISLPFADDDWVRVRMCRAKKIQLGSDSAEIWGKKPVPQIWPNHWCR